jgi:hypothetical protein
LKTKTETGENRRLTRGAMLLALLLIIQSLKFMVPAPPFVYMFLIGSLVNACLLLGIAVLGWRYAALLSIIAPAVAYLHQTLPLPIFILPVMVGNLSYVSIFSRLSVFATWIAVITAAIGKMIALHICVTWLLPWVDLPPKAAAALATMVSWPQLVTGVIGGVLATRIIDRLHNTIQTKL